MAKARIEFMPPWERPVRIPPPVPLEHSEPAFAIAGEKSTWRLPFRLARRVPPRAILKLQVFATRSNQLAFGNPQTDNPGGDDYITARTPQGTPLHVKPDARKGTFIISPPEAGLPAGATLSVVLGDRSGGGGGTKAPESRLLNKFFLLYLADDEDESLTTWTLEDNPPIIAACTMHVLGGATHHLRAYAPSFAVRGEAFEVLVRPEDEFSNLSYEVLRDVSVFAGGKQVQANVEQVPGSTCVKARVSLPQEGVYRVKVQDGASGKEAVANPTVCADAEPALKILWGMIHGHSEMSDGRGSVNYYFPQMRDEAGLDFGAFGDHDHLYETTDSMWRMTCETVAKENAPGSFVTFLGYEWAKWRKNGDGDRNVYYLEDNRPMYRSDESNYPSPPDLFKALKDEKAIVIPHHTGHSGNFCDWKDHDPERERLVEIFQMRGSYENSEEEGNPVPERTGTPPIASGYVNRALEMGWRVGFTAGGDDHVGHAGTDFPTRSGKMKYKAGLMAVPAAERTREAIWEAMWNRRVIATTGPRILLTYELNGNPIGSELDAHDVPGLLKSRILKIEFHGTAPAERIDVIRNNKVVKSFAKPGLDAELSWEDTTPLADALLPAAKFRPNPFCFYYVRAVQEDGEVAWASPIWIDA